MSGVRQPREDDRERSQVERKAGVAGEGHGEGLPSYAEKALRGCESVGDILWFTRGFIWQEKVVCTLLVHRRHGGLRPGLRHGHTSIGVQVHAKRELQVCNMIIDHGVTRCYVIFLVLWLEVWHLPNMHAALSLTKDTIK